MHTHAHTDGRASAQVKFILEAIWYACFYMLHLLYATIKLIQYTHLICYGNIALVQMNFCGRVVIRQGIRWGMPMSRLRMSGCLTSKFTANACDNQATGSLHTHTHPSVRTSTCNTYPANACRPLVVPLHCTKVQFSPQLTLLSR